MDDVLSRYLLSPTILWALLVLPALAVLAFIARRRRHSLITRLGPPGVIAAQTDRPPGRWRAAVVWSLGLALLVVGAAGPRWGLGPPPPTAPGRDIVAVVDLSRSMLAQDALPSRLGKAKEALRELADAVQAQGGHRLALVAFAGQAAVVCPLTHDYDHFRAKLAALSADPPLPAVRSAGSGAISGTRIGVGLQRAVELLDPQFRGADAIVLISDGDDPAGDEEWRLGLAAAREAGIPVDVVGVGDPNADSPVPIESGRLKYRGTEVHTRLQEPPLREIAGRTGGEYVAVRNGPPALDDLIRRRIVAGPTRESVAGTLPQPIGRQDLFLGLALTFIIGTMLALSPRTVVRGLFAWTALDPPGTPSSRGAGWVTPRQRDSAGRLGPPRQRRSRRRPARRRRGRLRSSSQPDDRSRSGRLQPRRGAMSPRPISRRRAALPPLPVGRHRRPTGPGPVQPRLLAASGIAGPDGRAAAGGRRYL